MAFTCELWCATGSLTKALQRFDSTELKKVAKVL